jgi:phosphate:Na+ symporter
MDVFTLIYTVAGGLGIFFYGMKSMSEALQSMSGDMIKRSIKTLTKNRVYALVVGVVVTCLVQSSSVTTVMVVGFVNAGLMELVQAIGIIFGANIGTTITGWIISIKVGKYGLLFIGLGIFPMLFSNKDKMRQIGRVLFGIGMVFFGLKLMSDAFKPLRSMPEFLDAISYFSGQHYGAYIASIVIGCLLTMVVQSSSAMLGITIALASSGTILFHTAAALVLGENIGTTITALLAAVGGNTNAKRAARAHMIFNLCGVAVVFAFFPLFVQFVDSLVAGDPHMTDSEGGYPNIAIHIATGHTLFNVTASLIFLPFLNRLAKLVIRITPEKEGEKEQYHLVVLGDPKDMVPATALTLVQAEVFKMKTIIDRMYTICRDLYSDKPPKTPEQSLSKIKNYEQVTDKIQREITLFVSKLTQLSMSEQESLQSQSYVKVADELESIADYLEKLALCTTRPHDQRILTGDSLKDFRDYFTEVETFFNTEAATIEDFTAPDMQVTFSRSEELREKAEAIRERHLIRVSEGNYDALTTLTYSDMIVSLRKIRSHTQNLAHAHSKTFI